jgi:hypothetical protein
MGGDGNRMLSFPRARRMPVSLEWALSDSLVRFLTREVRSYQRRIPNNLENLKKHIRPRTSGS